MYKRAKKARARAVTADYPMYANERTANDPILAQLAADGRAFWQHRGVYVPKDMQVNVADNLSDTDHSGGVAARGLDSRYGQPRVILNGYEVGRFLAIARSKRASVEQRRDAIWRLGQVMYHEEGHTAGLEQHTPGGLMGANPSRADTPWEVRQYAKRLIKSKKVKGRRRPASGAREDW